MDKIINGTLKYLAECSLVSIDHKTPGLLSGSSGDLLFLIEYYTYCKKDIDPILSEVVLELAQRCNLMSNYSFYSFCNGKAGVDLFYNYLYERDLLDSGDLIFLLNKNESQNFLALEQLKKGNYDFLHGALGIAYSLMYDSTNLNKEFFYSFFLQMENMLKEYGMFKSFDFNLNRVDNCEVNLGLAHGITSILKFCLLAYQKGICPDKADKIAKQIINYLLSKIDYTHNKSFFSNVVNASDNGYDNSRLGWCYGDLTIGFILYQASLIFKSEEVKSIALAILSYCATRRSLNETRVFDASICHGSAGVAHVFNKMWNYTKNSEYKKAADFWINQTLEFGKLTSTSEYIEYNAYNPKTDKHEPVNGILMGASGVGLVLLSYISNDFNWDRCIMLD